MRGPVIAPCDSFTASQPWEATAHLLGLRHVHRASPSAEHNELTRIAGAPATTARPDRPDPVAVAGLRWELTRKPLLHLAKEDKPLHPRLKSPPEIRAGRLRGPYRREFSDDMEGLAATYNAYITGWSATRIKTEWLAFRAPTQTIVRALTERIDRKEREFYRRIH